jgi:hypothetical protein
MREVGHIAGICIGVTRLGGHVEHVGRLETDVGVRLVLVLSLLRKRSPVVSTCALLALELILVETRAGMAILEDRGGVLVAL